MNPTPQRAPELVDPTIESDYWRAQFADEPYYIAGRAFEHYEPAYRAGYEGRVKYDGRPFDEVEKELASDYLHYADDNAWDEVRPATRAAWDRIDERLRGLTGN